MTWRWLKRVTLLTRADVTAERRDLTTVSDPDLAEAKARLAWLEAQVSLAGLGLKPQPQKEGDP